MSEILSSVKKNIIINAGHHQNDSGAVHGDIIERDECYKVRDELVPILKARGYTVHFVPDNLTLSESIAWANTKAPNLNDGLAIDIHFNFLSMGSARGTEAFYGRSSTSREIAATLSSEVSDALDIPNRGAKPDTQTAVGSLGWIRKTTMWATLVEVCFITNADDMEAIQAPKGYEKAAVGIADGVDELFGVAPLPIPDPEPEIPEIEQIETEVLINELHRRSVEGTL